MKHFGPAFSAMIGLWFSAPAAEAAAHHARAPEPAAALVTPGPELHELLRRQNGDTDIPTTLWYGTDKTCGYLSGSAGAALTCNSGSTCNFIPDLLPTQTSKIGIQLCCDALECNGFVTCVNSEIAVNPTSCDDVCQGNAFTLKCSTSDTPFCRTIVYSSSITNYDCVKFSPTAIAVAAFTYDDFSGIFPFKTTTLPPLSSGASGGNGFLPPIATPDPPKKSDTPSESNAADNSEPTDDSGNGGKKSNTGAIVGGTVGGIAAIGLLGLGALFLVRKRKNAAEQQQQQGPPPPPQSDMASPQPMMQNYQAHPQAGYFPQHPHQSMGGPHSPSTMADTIAYTASPGTSPVPEEQKFQSFVQSNHMAPSTYDPRTSMMSGPDGNQMAYGQQGMIPQQPSPDQMWAQAQGPPPVQQQPVQPQQHPYEMGSHADHHRGNMHEMYAPPPNQ